MAFFFFLLILFKELKNMKFLGEIFSKLLKMLSVTSMFPLQFACARTSTMDVVAVRVGGHGENSSHMTME